MTQDKNNPRSLKALYDETVREINAASMTPAMQAARDGVIEAAKRIVFLWERDVNAFIEETRLCDEVRTMRALEAQEKEQADAEGA